MLRNRLACSSLKILSLKVINIVIISKAFSRYDEEEYLNLEGEAEPPCQLTLNKYYFLVRACVMYSMT